MPPLPPISGDAPLLPLKGAYLPIPGACLSQGEASCTTASTLLCSADALALGFDGVETLTRQELSNQCFGASTLRYLLRLSVLRSSPPPRSLAQRRRDRHRTPYPGLGRSGVGPNEGGRGPSGGLRNGGLAPWGPGPGACPDPGPQAPGPENVMSPPTSTGSMFGVALVRAVELMAAHACLLESPRKGFVNFTTNVCRSSSAEVSATCSSEESIQRPSMDAVPARTVAPALNAIVG